MSNGDFFAPPLSERRPVAPPPGADAAPRDRRRWLLVAGLVALLALVVTAAVHLRRPPQDPRPVVLPDEVQGLALAPAADQFAASDWRTSMQKVLGDMPLDGRRYGTLADHRVVNVVVMRGTSDEAGDARLGSEPWTTYGEVRCTHTIVLPALTPGASPQASSLPGRVLCVRSRDTLTVSAFVLVGAEAWEQQAAGVVDEVWSLQG